LVRESADGCWTLPGGWADIGLTPSEVIVKEFKEEAGLDVTTTQLLAVFDKKCHLHPPQPFYVYKMVFLCEPKNGIKIEKGFDILDAAFFSINNLPVLSENRILKSQIELVYKNALSNMPLTHYD
jgi:ADP-ribose pyrophosphatase YjhB (NUDIX family)